jgi:hypothetical protein
MIAAIPQRFTFEMYTAGRYGRWVLEIPVGPAREAKPDAARN